MRAHMPYAVTARTLDAQGIRTGHVLQTHVPFRAKDDLLIGHAGTYRERSHL